MCAIVVGIWPAQLSYTEVCICMCVCVCIMGSLSGTAQGGMQQLMFGTSIAGTGSSTFQFCAIFILFVEMPKYKKSIENCFVS